MQRKAIGRLWAAALVAVACRAGGPGATAEPFAIAIAGPPDAPYVEAGGLGELAEPEGGWSAVLRVGVASALRADGPAMAGRYESHGATLRFVPRFAFAPELEYAAVLRRALLPRATGAEPDLVHRFVVPRSEPAVAPVVEAVHPTARPLPANVLKFYVHFSRPMARGYAYEHAHVLTEDGARVARPFLEVGDELWNPEGTRLTLLVDPGRIKRGLLLHEQVGPVFEPGRAYALIIEAGWPGADGARLATDVRVAITTAEPDLAQPDPGRWGVAPPTAGTLEPLVVALDEPLDHALAQHMLRVIDADTGELAGAAALDSNGARWTFTPSAPWGAGLHVLRVDPDLEDLAGNSVGRLFETRLGAPRTAPASPAVRLPFRPRPAPLPR